MRTAAALWHELERPVVAEATADEWRARLDEDDLAVLSPFLGQTGRIACTYPCGLGRAGCERDVVEHPHDDVEAVCRSPSMLCDTLAVEREKLLLLALDAPRLLCRVGEALALDAVEPMRLDGVADTWRVGAYRPGLDGETIVYATFESDPRHAQRHVERVLGVETRRVLWLTCATHVNDAVSRALRAHGGAALRLVDVTAIDACSLVAAPETEAVLRGLELTPSAARSSALRPAAPTFPTPSGATWRDLEIRFRDGESVSIRVGDVRRVASYVEMGMADGRTAAPDAQWQLLRRYADERGALTWGRDSDLRRRNKKRTARLAAALRDYFKLPGDPIEYVPDTKGWRTRFFLVPESERDMSRGGFSESADSPALPNS